MITFATLPKEGEAECGDCCGWWDTPTSYVMAVIDGLGHGMEAAYAARKALQCVEEMTTASIEAIFAECNDRLRPTRGAAMAVAVVQKDSGKTILASVGNIRLVWMTSSKVYRFGASRGIVGGGYHSLSSERIHLVPGDLIAIFSDGIDEFVDMRSVLNEVQITDDQTSAWLHQWTDRKDDAALLFYQHFLHTV